MYTAVMSAPSAVLPERITQSPDQAGGLPCIRGLRIPVVTVLNMLADGMTAGEVVDAYPDLTTEDVFAALRFAASRVGDERAAG